MVITEEKLFLDKVLQFIEREDALHYKKIRKNIEEIIRIDESCFYMFLGLVHKFFKNRGLSAETVSAHYLRMINDMRIEGIHFKKHKKYSCNNQHEAYVNVYSKPEVMEYYMNALLMSQILWLHHFRMLMFFNDQLTKDFLKGTETVLDIGPGHGFFSYLVRENLKEIDKIDIVDISEGSLEMTKRIIGTGDGKIRYFNRDIFTFSSDETYDLIILGEVLEHLDEPLIILKKLGDLLNPSGYLWLTTPTNAPALDHVYLFRSKDDILDLLNQAKFTIAAEFGCFAEDVSEEMAARFDISFLYGAFLKKPI